MPAIAKDKENNIHIVYANGDSILYVFSKDGKSYSAPALVAVLPDLWTENENIIVMKPNGQKVNLGKGSLPILKAINNDKVICIWENENEIHTSFLSL